MLLGEEKKKPSQSELSKVKAHGQILFEKVAPTQMKLLEKKCSLTSDLGTSLRQGKGDREKFNEIKAGIKDCVITSNVAEDEMAPRHM